MRLRPPAGARAGELVLAALAVAMLLYRFAHADALTFINDEPNLLHAAREQLTSGHWVKASPIFGTQGLRYGPFPTWFYGVVQAAFGPSPFTCIRAMTVIVSASELLLVAALARAFRGGVGMFAALLAVVASSPYAFLWSRQAWDNPLVAVAAAVVVSLLASRRVGLLQAAMAAPLLGAMLATHLMSAPFVACAGAALVLAVAAGARPGRASRRASVVRRALLASAAAAAVAAGALAVNATYLPYVLENRGVARGAAAPPILDLLFAVPGWLAEAVRVWSLWDVSYFFGSTWSDFRAWAGPLGVVFDLATAPGVVLAAIALALVVVAARGRTPRERRLARFALVVWVAHALFLASRQLERHPHYQMPVTWVVPLGLAALLAWARSRSARAARLVRCAAWTLAVAQLAFVIAWTRWVEERTGTREVHVATPLAAQTEIVREACRRTKVTNVRLANETVLFPASLEYVAEVEPACAGMHLTVCGGSCPPDATATTFTLAYAAREGGAVTLR